MKKGFKLSPEAKVGIFVLFGVALLVVMSLKLGGIRFGRAQGYTLTVDFDSAAGLDKGGSVRVAGVEVGRVKEIQLKNNKAHLILQINPGIKIGKDFTAVLTAKGLLGEKYLELIPGSPNAPPLQNGEAITRTTTYVDMDRLITTLNDVAVDVKGISESLNKVLGGPEGEETIRTIVKNIEEISDRVNHMVAKNDERVDHIMTSLDEFTTLLRTQGPMITDDLRTALKNLNDSMVKTSNNLNEMIAENRGNLKEGVENLKLASAKLQETMATIDKVTQEITPGVTNTVKSVNSIATKIDKGEGTIGKLINDPQTHDNLNKAIVGINNYIAKTESFHTFIGYRGEYLFDRRNTKSYFSLRIQPKTDKYYLLEVVDDPNGKINRTTTTTTTGGVTTTTEETKITDAIKFTAEIAKRIRMVTLRGGIIESTGGAGMDINMFDDHVKVSFDAFDFTRSAHPHLKAWGTFYINRYFFLTAGYDNFVNKELRSGFIGAGFQFDDEDIKYLLSSAPPVKF
jgi:phospholipid/cholesterol/gamma-HCH transport system substrate-binding protein